MLGLYYAHSGLRYLVLLAGLVAVIQFLVLAVGKKELSKTGRILGATFAGLLDLQVLIGLVLLAMRPFMPMVIGHIVMMVLAAVLTHVLLLANRRRPKPGAVLPLVAVGVAMLLVVGGIFAIGRGPLQSLVLGV